MRLADLEKHLRQHGCRLERQGGNHALWINPGTGRISPVPRHREVKEGTIRSICRQLTLPLTGRP